MGVRALLLLPGRDAWLLGRLLLPSREAPKESRLVPDSLALCIVDAAEACDARLRLLRTVTVLGICPMALAVRGLARGGVVVGAGNLDLV